MKNGLPFSILVVDDDPDDRMFIDEAFKQIGYDAEVKKFIDGEGLFHYLEQVDPPLYPSLIVLDNTVAALEASDILSLLKENPAYRPIPVVIYTAALSPTKKEQMLSKGAYACLEKGNTMNELVPIAKELQNLAEAKLNAS